MELEEIKQKLGEANAERKRNIKKYWENLKPFIDIDDVPPLPTPDDEKEWKEFYVPKLIGAGAIAKKDLKDGGYYYGEYRRANIGKWNVKEQKFEHWRYKFGWRTDWCNHFEDDDGFALFVPIREANEEEIKGEKLKG